MFEFAKSKAAWLGVPLAIKSSLSWLKNLAIQKLSLLDVNYNNIKKNIAWYKIYNSKLSWPHLHLTMYNFPVLV